MPDTDTTDQDEQLDEAAQGTSVTAEDTTDGETGEIDTIGEAAGFVVRDEKPLHGVEEELERRDEHRWELNPASEAEDGPEQDDDLTLPAR